MVFRGRHHELLASVLPVSALFHRQKLLERVGDLLRVQHNTS